MSKKDEYNFLLYVPEIVHSDWELVDEKVLLNFKISSITKFVGFLVKKKAKKDILFDERCTSAWLLIDGEKSIYEIAKIINKNRANFEEELMLLVEYIKYISKQGWIRYKRVKKQNEVVL